MKKRLIRLLAFLPEGQGINLLDDTFLTGMLDGSDKIYGFGKENGEIVVITGSSMFSYPVSDMDKEDLNYVFNLSSPNIFEKIKTAQYRIDDNEDI
jgi:hypothetical protein